MYNQMPGRRDSETDRPTLTDRHKHTCHVMRVMTCVCVCIIKKSYRSICKIKMSSKPGCHYRYTPTTTTTTTSTLDKFCTCIKFNCKKSPSFLLCLALRQQSEGRRNLCVHVVQIRHNRPFLATYDYIITMITLLQ